MVALFAFAGAVVRLDGADELLLGHGAVEAAEIAFDFAEITDFFAEFHGVLQIAIMISQFVIYVNRFVAGVYSGLSGRVRLWVIHSELVTGSRFRAPEQAAPAMFAGLWPIGGVMPILRQITSVVCVVLVVIYTTPGAGYSQNPPPAAAPAATQDAPLLPDDQVDSLVAPIALYPDPLLSQVLVASTYPLEVVQLQQYLEKNPTLKGKALTDAVEKQDWDPSIQAMAALPDAVKQLADNIQWTQELGNAFLADQAQVMDAVQRMRNKAEGTGALKTTPQQDGGEDADD